MNKIGVYQPGSFIAKSNLLKQELDNSVTYLTLVNVINKTEVMDIVGCQIYPWNKFKTEDDCLIKVIYKVFLSMKYRLEVILFSACPDACKTKKSVTIMN